MISLRDSPWLKIELKGENIRFWSLHQGPRLQWFCSQIKLNTEYGLITTNLCRCCKVQTHLIRKWRHSEDTSRVMWEKGLNTWFSKKKRWCCILRLQVRKVVISDHVNPIAKNLCMAECIESNYLELIRIGEEIAIRIRSPMRLSFWKVEEVGWLWRWISVGIDGRGTVLY